MYKWIKKKFQKKTYRVICAWCDIIIEEKVGNCDGDSHTFCSKCKEKAIKDPTWKGYKK